MRLHPSAHPVCLCLILASGLLLSAIAAPARADPPATDLTPGTLIERVTCADDPGQSYALYLPANYTADRAWPIVYCFDPGARGSQPVERFQQAAEQSGYILAGSNNSHNGPWAPIAAAADAMIRDTHRRLRLDDRRRYAAGMSGGARSACSVALAAHFAGVIACSGGFPEDKVPPEAVFAFFGTTGREDFNYQEMRRIDAALEARNTPHRLAIFGGGHEWLPVPLTADALEWLDLQAMRSGLRSRDEALVARRLQRRMQSAGAMKNDGEAYLAWLAIAADFNGLADIAAPAAKAAALKDTKPVRQYLKAEKKAQRQEERWLERFQAAVEQARHPAPRTLRREVVETLRRQSGADEDPRFGNPNPDRLRDPNKEFRPDVWLRPEIDLPSGPADGADRFAALRDLAAIARRDAESSLPARRALIGSFAVFSEQGREQLDAQNSDGAIEHLEVAAILRPEAPGIYFQLARAYALRGDRDRAREFLATALAKGFQDDTRVHELQASLTR